MIERLRASDFMSTKLVTLSPDTDIHEAMRLLIARDISGAPVVGDNGEIVGILAEKDCFKIAFAASYHREHGGSVAEYMSREVQTIDADMEIVEVAELFLKGPYRRFPVVQDHRLVGLISRRDVLAAIEKMW